MPNEFKVRNGLIVDSGVSVISGSLIVLGGITGSLSGSSGGGGSVSDFPFTGSAGISGSLIVNGPITVTGSLIARQTGFNAAGIFTGDSLGGIALTTTSSNGFSVFTLGGALQIYDNVNAATRFTLAAGGGITANSFTGSLQGTASFAVSASWAPSVGGGGAAFPFTGSAGITGSLAVVGPTSIRGNLTVTGSSTNALSVRGSGTTTATNTMRVENSAGTPIMIIRDDLTVGVQSIVSPGSAFTQYPLVSASLQVIAFGNGSTEATARNAVALGDNNKAKAPYSIAAGNNNKAFGTSSVAMGEDCTASSSYSTTFGRSNEAKGLYAFSAGYQNTSSGSYSVTMGGQNTANGLRSVAIGEGNITPGSRGIAIGISNTAVQSQDVAIGGNNRADGGLTMCIGTYLSSSASGQVVVGQYNRTSSLATFIIGSGTSNAARSNIVEVVGTTFRVSGSLIVTGSVTARQTGFNASGIFTGETLGGIALTTTASNGFSLFTIGGTLQIYDNTGAATRFYIDGSGNVGLGTSSPAERLHIVASGGGADIPLYIAGTNTKGGSGYLDFLKVENTGGGVPNPKKFFRINNSDGGWEVVNDAYSQTIMKLEDNGNMQIAGTLSESSDESLKTNIQTIPNALEKTLQLRGVEYDRISTNKHEIGLIAQEVEQIFPELVSEANEIKSVAYSKVVSILIESIKELKREIDILREQINKK